MSETKKLLKEIKEGLNQKSSSNKDEVRVMQAMLNDSAYVVDVYGATGKIGEYSPSADARKMTSSIIAATTKISRDEADLLAKEHEYTKNEAASMVNISKEFINTYTETGRKIRLGGRELSNVSLVAEDVEAAKSRYPKKVVDASGEHWESVLKDVPTPAHRTIKVKGTCPTWVR